MCVVCKGEKIRLHIFLLSLEMGQKKNESYSLIPNLDLAVSEFVSLLWKVRFNMPNH